jgi:lysophospholipase L1-like esterase/pimeloyl-ACP methyl ester carboxylesterase
MHVRAQVKWDDTETKNWPEAFKKIKIISSFDKSEQLCIVYASNSIKPQPLVVSLHSWSGDFLQTDSMAMDVSRRNWNYIHPDFRGPNNKPLACGSDAAIQDIDDAIQWALKNMNVDPKEVHIIGSSGGGYMTMMCYMNMKYPAKSFSSWVGISDLEAWYYESLGRGQKYAGDILKCMGESTFLNIVEARKRSPLRLPLPKRNATLHLYAGIHDGYRGSVPITHTMHFYNKVVAAQKNYSKNAIVSPDEMLNLVVSRTSEKPYIYDLGKRNVHLHKQSGPVSLTIFEGGHEMIVSVAANLLPVYEKEVNKPWHVLAIGDSNGDLPGGWVHRLEMEVPWIKLVNAAKGGRTIGFDNNKDTTLNERRLLDQHLQKAKADLNGNVDWVIVALGTNDAKADFDGREEEVIANYQWILNRLMTYKKELNLNYRILAILPPPVEGKANLNAKYAGANNRLSFFNKTFKTLATERGILVLDAFEIFSNYKDTFTTDGVHLNERAQKQLSLEIQRYLFQ